MNCSLNNNISFNFPDSGLELVPYTVDFRVDRHKLNYVNAKFSTEVGDYLKPKVKTEGSEMRDPQPVQILMDGKVSYWVYFRPEYARFGETNCWIEFQDLREHFRYETVDYKVSNSTAKELYRKVYAESNIKNITNGIEFEIPQDAESTLNTSGYFYDDDDLLVEGVRYLDDFFTDYDKENEAKKKSVLDSIFKFDLHEKTLFEAFLFLNEKLGLSWWVTPDGVLKIGIDYIQSNNHAASSSESNVWKYTNPNIVPPGQPIKKAVVNGGLIDAPGSIEDGLLEKADFVLPDKQVDDDLVAQGIAQRPDIVGGKTVSIDLPELERASLESRAEHTLLSEMMNNNSGTIEINPSASNNDVSDWRDIQIGDTLEVFPPKSSECGSSIEHQTLLISGIRHNVDAGSWKIELQVQKTPSYDVVTSFRYFDPQSEKYYDSDFNEI